MFKNVSLTFKMLLFTVIVGLATWSVLDPLHTRNISEAFHTELSDKLREDAHANRLHVDLYLQAFHLMARLITSQKEFYVQGRTFILISLHNGCRVFQSFVCCPVLSILYYWIKMGSREKHI